jgi:hypothetical protein
MVKNLPQTQGYKLVVIIELVFHLAVQQMQKASVESPVWFQLTKV